MKRRFWGATLLDPGTGKVTASTTLTAKDGVIQKIGPDHRESTPDDDFSVDMRGRYVMPGLIDCHVHLDLHGMADTYQENLVEDKLRTLRAAQEAEATLRAGFTTVRNVGSVNGIDFALKAGFAAGYCRGPRLITAGRIISMTCSGTEYFAGMYRVADGPDACRQAAREELKAGADFLKLMATGAIMNPGGVPGASQLGISEMQAIVEEGLKLGKHTAAHAHGAEGIRNAVAAGVRTIEHGTMADTEALEAMAKAAVYLIPTFSPKIMFARHADRVPKFMVEKSRRLQDAYVDTVRQAKKLGVMLAMGTDAGTNFNYHGRNAGEIVYLVEQGIMTPMEALKAATWTAAQAIGQAHRVGSLSPGKMADMLVLQTNPLEDIRALLDPSRFSVYLGAEPVE